MILFFMAFSYELDTMLYTSVGIKSVRGIARESQSNHEWSNPVSFCVESDSFVFSV